MCISAVIEEARTGLIPFPKFIRIVREAELVHFTLLVFLFFST